MWTMTREEERILKTVAAYNGLTETEAQQMIVKRFLDRIMTHAEVRVIDMVLPQLPEQDKEEPKKAETTDTPPKRRGGRPKKMLSSYVNDTAAEVERRERMSKDEFVEAFAKLRGRGEDEEEN